MSENNPTRQSNLPDDQTFERHLARRHTRSGVWRGIFLMSTLIGLIALVALFGNVINEAFGTVAFASKLTESEISDVPLSELDGPALAALLGEYAPRRLRVIVRDELSVVSAAEFTTVPVSVALAHAQVPESMADRTIAELSDEEVIQLLALNLTADQLYDHVQTDVIGLELLKSWPLSTTLFDYATIQAEFDALVEEKDPPNPHLEFRSWLNWDFVTGSQSSYAELAGVRTAIVGTLWIMALTMLIAFPLGIGAAIYLEEYARGGGWFDRLIEVNIRNLAGVPSIIYGLLGLAIFVRTLEQLTSGAMFGVTGVNGRTILSASATMALLILPVIIIASQEAIRAVPQSIREASYGLGATKWQTVWHQVLPAAMPGILTGTIIALSRAIGETAPLIVIGASAVIFVDPSGPFSKFTALPIQIWQWTARPQEEFRNIAAAAIIVLLGLLLFMNSFAIILRQRLSKKL
jgi:phosphate transport system permease protein